MAKASKILHEQHKDTIIQTFYNLSISLNLDRFENLELRIQDLLNTEVGDYILTKEDQIIVDDSTPSSTSLDF